MFRIEFISFPLELLAATLLFSCHFRLRKHGVAWAILFTALLLLFSANTLAFNPITDAGIKKAAYYFIIEFLLLAGLYASYQMDWTEAVVMGVAGYTTQHLAYDVYMLFLSIARLDMDDVAFTPQGYALILAIDILSYAAIYLLFSRNFRVNRERIRTGSRWIALSILALLLDILFNIVFIQNHSKETWLAFYSYDLVCTVLVLMVLLYASQINALQEEIALIRQIQKLKQEQYETSKETIDLINIKCHDIRQQILNFRDREGRRMNQEFIDQMEKTVTIYDAIYHTGNEPLDVILTEKSLLCGNHQVRLACMADAGSLGFMEESDIYSLLGNIIDNAFESVCKLADTQDRVINLEIRKRGNLLNIQEENYYAGDVLFENGLPVTSKQDKRYHGFGIKSIRMLVEKYKGELQIQAQDQVFSINILIPIPVPESK